MGYFSKGYNVICLSLLLHLVIYIIVISLLIGTARMEFYSRMFTWLQILMVCIQLCGILFCLLGYRRSETISSRISLNVLFVLWGSLEVYLMAWNYSSLSSYQTRNLTLWDCVTMLSWALKGFIWIALGLVFTAISFVKEAQKQTMNMKNNRTRNKLNNSSIC